MVPVRNAQMDRGSLLRAWWRHYSRKPSGEALELALARSQDLEARMRDLGTRQGPMYKGFNRYRLMTAFGMSLGVHKQVLRWLTSSSSGAYYDGRRGGSEVK